MPASSKTQHPHFPKFMSGLAIAVLIVIMGMLAYNYMLQASKPPEKVGQLATALRTAARNNDYESVEKLTETLLNVAVTHMERNNIEEASTGFRQIREVISQIREKTDRQSEERASKYSFRSQFGEASYRYSECLFLALEKKYPVKDDGQPRQLPFAETSLIRKVIEEGLKSTPSDKRLHWLHGMLKRLTGSFASAVTALEKSINLDNNFAEAYNELGLVYVNLKEQEKARHNFEKALLTSGKESATHKTALFNLGIYYANVNHGDDTAGDGLTNRKKAIKHFQDFLSLEKSDTSSAKAARKALAKLGM